MRRLFGRVGTRLGLIEIGVGVDQSVLDCAVACQGDLDGKVAEMKRLAALGYDRLLSRQAELHCRLYGDGGPYDLGARLTRDWHDIGHMVEVRVAQKNHVRHPYISGGKADGARARRTIVICIEKIHFAPECYFVVGIA